ncbi:MAG: hypothetical protein HFE79_13930 [Ruminiclostridium sp.]|nr:hypothetical protein [Ruminiclostridium sp.]
MAKFFVNVNGQLVEVGKGNSAYDIAIQNGYAGTEQEWLNSLKGNNGKDGRSITSINQDNNGNIIATFSDGITQNIGRLTADIQGNFLTSEGFGNLRYYNGHFQYYNFELHQWEDISVSTGVTDGVKLVYNDGTVIEGAEIIIDRVENVQEGEE